MLQILPATLATAYLGLMLYLWLGLLKKGRPRATVAATLPSVSVVIPMRNEEAFIKNTLDAINAQKYAGEWQAIIVNDRSTDSSPQIVHNFCQTHPNFSLIDIPQNAPQIASPKKRALTTGFLAAKGEFLLTADADCTPPPNWLNSMALCFANGASVVQGSKVNTGGKNFLHAYQRLETLGFTLIEAAGYNRNKPLVASAASLGYSKALFFKCGGFEDLYNLASGDDDMLIHKMAKIEGTTFAYNWDTSAIMPTAPVDSWKALLQQRARWGSNGTKYESKIYSAFLFCIYAFFLWLLISPWLVLANILPLNYFLLPFAAKLFADFLLLFTGALRFRHHSRGNHVGLLLLWCFPFVELIQIPLFAAAVPLGMLGLYRWKN
ncbi:MAG: glycosyltransferase [Fibromonadaceae bacterium]|jgi:cellulose synthase/poly-beta-1,6-N-acetylglucosamine synthase-like glycosyltransferase|nr:glycosyltransferase [Fibromonadaceae bacterium]